MHTLASLSLKAAGQPTVRRCGAIAPFDPRCSYGHEEGGEGRDSEATCSVKSPGTGQKLGCDSRPAWMTLRGGALCVPCGEAEPLGKLRDLGS